MINIHGGVKMIKCDICGYPLEIDQDGMAHCKHCGMNYTIEAVKKKYQGNHSEKKEDIKKSFENTKHVRLEIRDIQTSIFSKVPTFIANVLDGDLKSRDFLCLEGTESPSYRVEWVQEYSGDAVRFRLEGVTKKMFKVGQVFETSYEKETRFKQILNKHFKSYEIQEDVMIEEGFYPISYLLVENDKPKLAILLCNSRSYNSKAIQSTMNMCEDVNIPVQRYYKDFRNDEEYICNRIKSVL